MGCWLRVSSELFVFPSATGPAELDDEAESSSDELLLLRLKDVDDNPEGKVRPEDAGAEDPRATNWLCDAAMGSWKVQA